MDSCGGGWVTSIECVLLDLDGTLIQLDQEEFLGAYMQEVVAAFHPQFAADQLAAEIWRATAAVRDSTDATTTNQEVFFASFLPRLAAEAADVVPRFERLYRERFPALRALARPHPRARAVVEELMATGYRVAVATNPLFPLTAISERLTWAGVHDLPFDLITTLENMHSCKPNPGYFSEVARRLEVCPRRCLMVGDDFDLDLVGADAVGMITYHVAPVAAADREGRIPHGGGDLGQLPAWLAALRAGA